MVHAPHNAWPQPNFVPVMFSTSRSVQSSGVSSVTSTSRIVPLTLSLIMALSLLRPRLASLLGDDVLGVPVRPIHGIVLAGSLLVLAVGSGCTSQRRREVGGRGKGGRLRVDTLRQPRRDLLQEP